MQIKVSFQFKLKSLKECKVHLHLKGQSFGSYTRKKNMPFAAEVDRNFSIATVDFGNQKTNKNDVTRSSLTRQHLSGKESDGKYYSNSNKHFNFQACFDRK